MRLKAALEGKLDALLDKEYQNAVKAVTAGIKTATNGLKQSLRSQVKAAKLGSRLANTWRGDIYPKAKNSISAAGVVYPKAQKILEGFEYQTVIAGKNGFWLAIPTYGDLIAITHDMAHWGSGGEDRSERLETNVIRAGNLYRGHNECFGVTRQRRFACRNL